jgi:hypothetical protein
VPKKVKKEDIERWKKLRHEGLTYEEIAKETSWSRQKIASEIKKLEPKKPPEAPTLPASNFLSFINFAGGIVQRKCPNKTDEGYCDRLEFSAEDWNVSSFKSIFPEFVVVVRGKRSYLRPKCCPWLCYLCSQRMDTDARIAGVDGKIARMDSRLTISLSEARGEKNRLREELLERIDYVGTDLQKFQQNLKNPIEGLKLVRMIGSTIYEACVRQYGQCELFPPRLGSLLEIEPLIPYMCVFCKVRFNEGGK